jgi:hypothetical protein
VTQKATRDKSTKWRVLNASAVLMAVIGTLIVSARAVNNAPQERGTIRKSPIWNEREQIPPNPEKRQKGTDLQEAVGTTKADGNLKAVGTTTYQVSTTSGIEEYDLSRHYLFDEVVLVDPTNGGNQRDVLSPTENERAENPVAVYGLDDQKNDEIRANEPPPETTGEEEVPGLPPEGQDGQIASWTHWRETADEAAGMYGAQGEVERGRAAAAGEMDAWEDLLDGFTLSWLGHFEYEVLGGMSAPSDSAGNVRHYPLDFNYHRDLDFLHKGRSFDASALVSSSLNRAWQEDSESGLRTKLA